MPRYYVRETFFRPPEYSRVESALPAPVYNALQLLLRRHDSESLFIPVRSMQFQAVVGRSEVLFVDSHGGYAHKDGVGGRLIRLAWRPVPPAGRDSLDAPVPCTILYYFPDLRETQMRLMSEFPPVLERELEGQRERSLKSHERRVLPFHR
jgi:hypothetical protein